MAHIAMITLDHPPDDDRIFHKEAKALLNAGYTVSVLCVTGPDGGIFSMSGEGPLNNKGQSTTSLDGIRVWGVPGPRTRPEELLKKGLKGGFISRFVKAGKALGPDVFHAHEPASLFLAFQMANQDPGKVVFDSHESWLSGSYRDFWIKRQVLPKLRYLITANSLTRGHLLAKNPNMKTQVIYNYPEARIFNRPLNPDKFHKPVIAHDGILPFNRGLDLMIKALIKLKATYPYIMLRIVGEPTGHKEYEYIQYQVKQHGLEDNLAITGWVHYEKIPDYLEDAAIGLIMKSHDHLNNVMGGPAIKLFNYMASGMAVIDSGLPESNFFLDAIEAGVTLKVRSPSGLAEALAYLIERPNLMQHYANTGLKATATWNWENEAPKLVKFYNQEVLSSDQSFLKR